MKIFICRQAPPLLAGLEASRWPLVYPPRARYSIVVLLAFLSPAKSDLLQDIYQASGEGFSSSLAVHVKAVIGAMLDMPAVLVGAVVGEPFPLLRLVHLQASVLKL